MMLALAAGQLRAGTETKTAYAVYCENSKELHFLCSDDNNLSSVVIGENTVNLVYNGDGINAWKGEDVMNKNDYSAPDWNNDKCHKATKVVFEPSFADAEVKCCYKWFDWFDALTAVTGLEYLKTSSETSMGNMFSNCRALTSLDLSKFDTSNVTDMSSMFSGCNKLTSLDLSNFNTSKVTDMSSMFSGCNKLTSLDLSNFDTSNVSQMITMFRNCWTLTSLDLSYFDTSRVSNVDYMLDGCYSLKFLDLSKAKGNKIPDMIGTLPSDAEPVIFVPSGTTLTGDRKNVISGDGGTCDNLEIDAYNLTSLSFPYSFTAEKITVTRSFEPGKPHTLYLPFAVDATAYGTFYTLKGYDATSQKVVFGKITEDKTTANTPYLFVPNESNTWGIGITAADGGIAVSKTTDAPQPETGLIGVYKKHTFDDTNKANCYGWADDKFMKAGSGASVGACRAYLKLPAESVIGNAPARLSIQLGDGTTGITAIKGGADGDSDSDAPMYNLQGQRVDKSYRGVVIKNGKKMIIK